MAWHGMAGPRVTLSCTDTYHTVPMFILVLNSLGTGIAVLPFLWIGSHFGSLSDLSIIAHGTPRKPKTYTFYSGCKLLVVAVAK